MTANLKVLIGKLDETCKKAAGQAINYCVARGQHEVELEHFFLALLDDTRSDVFLLAKRFGVSTDALEKDLLHEIAALRTGCTRTPVFSEHLPKLFEHAWLLASLENQTARIRSAHLLLALLTESDLSQLAHRSSPQFTRFSVDELKHKLTELIADYPESLESVTTRIGEGQSAAGSDGGLANAGGGRGKTPALDQFTTNLTDLAREGRIDPVIGREAEIRLMIDILMRRRQNNPILTGEAGVGKTAVVEGLAQRIADGDVPPALSDVALHVVDLGLLQAGASVKGEFENRLRNVIEEVKRSPHPIILFIDEAHMMIGAGGQAGQNDAANLLKPALARGGLRTIAATTWSEYKKYFERDAALARRFQVVKVDEPTEEVACAMLRGLTAKMEHHFNVRILEEAIVDAVRLSSRYLTGRQLPDKAISVLDTACARVALARTSRPAAIEDARCRAEALNQEITALEREASTGGSHADRLVELRQAQEANLRELQLDETRWEQEKTLADRIRQLCRELEAEATDASVPVAAASAVATSASTIEQASGGKRRKRLTGSARLKELDKLQGELKALQGEQPLVQVCVDGQAVGEIISSWTGIPLGKMMKDEVKTVLNLRGLLEERVMGQAHAMEQVARRVRTARANMEDPGKPKGVFLFVGPSGVGKTETALALADLLYGGERHIITINMSEYQEAHTVSGLKGSPPGYVGYGEGGILTEAVRRRPYSVVLLDEIEKAHPDVMELFFQVFDKGMLDDADGYEVDFRNTIVIMTSNAASQSIMQACLNKPPEELPDESALSEIIKPHLYKIFKPAFLARTKVIPFYPLSDDVLAQVINLKLQRIRKRVEDNHRAALTYTEDVVDAILARCTEVDAGARNVDHILNGSMLPEIAESVLARIADGRPVRTIRIATRAGSAFSYKIG